MACAEAGSGSLVRHRLLLVVVRPLRATQTGLAIRSGIRNVKCPHTLRGITAAKAGQSSFEVLRSMTLMRRRDKMISIRLSDDEFVRVREACRVTGARSVSDLARDAMRRLVAGAPVPHEAGGDGLCARVEDLDQKVNHLQEQVSRLALLVGKGDK